MNETDGDKFIGEYFDQNVDELGQLEKEQERKPDNEKIKRYIEEIYKLLDKLLHEVDNPIPRINAKDIGNAALGASRTPAEQIKEYYVDPSGIVHYDRDEANAAKGDDWRITG